MTLTFNQPPVAGDDAYETDQDVTLDVAAPGVLENDADVNEFDEITIEILTPPEHGSLTLNQDGSFIYVPDTKFFGEDSFEYRMYALPPSRAAFSADATVTITVHPAHQYFFPIAHK